jgi:hypothetical protein
MKIIIAVIAAIVSSFMFQVPGWADPGVVIEAKGSVTLTKAGRAAPAKTGAQFGDGDVVEVATGGAATLMFSNGAMRKLAGGERFTAAKGTSGQSKEKSLINGLAMAYNDATRASAGPTVHGMVKAAPGEAKTTQGQVTLPPMQQKLLAADLKQVDSMGLSGEGKALMQAQVYYKYLQYQKVIDLILPVYKAQNPPAEMVKNLIAVSYDKMGKAEEAGRYR